MLNDTNNDKILSLLPAIRATVAKILNVKDADAIEDVTNDVVVRLLSGAMDKCDGRASLKSWATITARNVALNHLNRHSVSKAHKSVNVTGTTSDDDDQGTSGVMLAGDDQNGIERALESSRLADAMSALLSAQEQTFLVARAEGMGIVEASEILGCSKSAAQRREVAMYDKLRKAL